MNSVAPCAAAKRRRAPCTVRPGNGERRASRPEASASSGAAGRSAGRSVGTPAQPLAPVGELRVRAPRPSSHRRCQTAKSAYWIGQLGQRRRLAPREGVVQRRQLALQHAQRPAVGDDVVHRQTAARDRRASSRSSVDAQQRPLRQIEGRAWLPRMRAVALRPRERRRASRLRSIRSAGHVARPRSSGRAAAGARRSVVRSASCRRTISLEAALERARHRARPASRSADGHVVGGAGLQLIEEPEPLLRERERQIGTARRRRDRGGQQICTPRRPASTASASPATVGVSKSLRSDSST